jgi:hypothetical protein
VTLSSLDARARGKLAEQMVPAALEFACLVRDQDAEAIGAWLQALTGQERDVLPLVLAAMVDVERTPQELLAWVTFDEEGWALPGDAEMVLWAPRQRARHAPVQPCGTWAAAQRHRKNREPPCEPCRDAEREYEALKRERKRQERQEEVA